VGHMLQFPAVQLLARVSHPPPPIAFPQMQAALTGCSLTVTRRLCSTWRPTCRACARWRWRHSTCEPIVRACGRGGGGILQAHEAGRTRSQPTCCSFLVQGLCDRLLRCLLLQPACDCSFDLARATRPAKKIYASGAAIVIAQRHDSNTICELQPHPPGGQAGTVPVAELTQLQAGRNAVLTPVPPVSHGPTHDRPRSH
jgi:hypothetical protein